MKNIETLTRGEVVTLNADRTPMSGVAFKAGEAFKFLGWAGTLVRLSRVGDNAKLTVLPEDIGYGYERQAATSPASAEKCTKYNAPHADESGASRRVVIASCLAGQHSGEVAMHMTQAEEREYNAGMAMLAERGIL